VNAAATIGRDELEREHASVISAPLISVLLPVYNAARYVDRAVQSILYQTERDFELIVVDDGSTDSSLDILKRHAARDPRVRLLSRANRGLVATLNEMLALARGGYVARMDADDIALPQRFARERAALDADPSLVAVGCSVYFIDPSDRRLMKCELPADHQGIVDWVMAIERGNGMSHPAMMMRADAVARIGGYREAFFPAEDADLVLRLAEIGHVANLAEPLLSYRLHPQSIGHLHAKRQRDAHFRCVAEAAARRGLTAPDESLRVPTVEPDVTEAERQVRWAWWAIGSGNLDSARSLALGALRCAPFSRAGWLALACAIRGY
jgi:glycosyltransferase involved in cell wall biosynthesis